MPGVRCTTERRGPPSSPNASVSFADDPSSAWGAGAAKNQVLFLADERDELGSRDV